MLTCKVLCILDDSASCFGPGLFVPPPPWPNQDGKSLTEKGHRHRADADPIAVEAPAGFTWRIGAGQVGTGDKLGGKWTLKETQKVL